MKNQQEGSKIRLAMLASGSGTNVGNFIYYYKDHPKIEIALVMSNNESALVLERARQAGVPAVFIPRSQWHSGHEPLSVLKDHDIDFVVLAGFLQLIPDPILQAFPRRIVNIHPALLPRFGGKGMYGSHVHEAVIQAGEQQSGISIHLVNEQYDKGKVLFQARVAVTPMDTPHTLAEKIHALEYEHYPRVVEEYVEELKIKN